jgi:hypothetical protein
MALGGHHAFPHQWQAVNQAEPAELVIRAPAERSVLPAGISGPRFCLTKQNPALGLDAWQRTYLCGLQKNATVIQQGEVLPATKLGVRHSILDDVCCYTSSVRVPAIQLRDRASIQHERHMRRLADAQQPTAPGSPRSSTQISEVSFARGLPSPPHLPGTTEQW